MLSIKDMQAFPEKYPVEAASFYPAFSASGRDVQIPKPRIVIRFKEEAPDLWEMLMTEHSEVGAEITGTRQVTGSGATDNMLYPVHRERLEAVNARREKLGFERIRN